MPKFNPVRQNLFPKEYDALLHSAREAIKRIRDDPAAWVSELTPDAASLYKFLIEDGQKERADELKRMPHLVVRKLMPDAQEAIAAWERRIAEIEAAKQGMRPA